MGLMNDFATDDLFASAACETGQASSLGAESVLLQGEVDLAGFRRAARRLLAQQVSPEQIQWHVAGGDQPSLFTGNAPEQTGDESGAPASAYRVPPDFVALLETVILHRDPNRFGLLYRLLWRLVHEPGLRHDPLDADRVNAQHLAQAVRRDMHKMKAFVRFTSVQDEVFQSNPAGGPLHVAWFEPEHHIVRAVAPFFARRFTQMRWAILTPESSLEWNGSAMRFGPGASKQDAPPADAGEQLWLTYYQHIFNPARLKLKAMQKEMPRRYWKNLPEAQFISQLAAHSQERQTRMIEQAPTVPHRRIPVFKEGPAAAARSQSTLALGELVAGESARDLPSLNAAAQRCRECPIGQHATQAVCGEGPARARLMIVGEQPGDQEDLRGRPLVGPAGQLFDRALAELGWTRADLFITNAVKHFKYEPRGKRRLHKTPSQQEAAACLHWLESEIELVQPQALLALGATAASSLLGRRVAVMSERGQWFERADGRRVLVTLHPAALLRAPPDTQAHAYQDWLQDLREAGRFATARPT